MQQYVPWIVTALALVALVLLLVWQNLIAVRRQAAAPPPLPTAWDLLPRPVFTADERRMYRQLQEALPHHVILAKLPLVRFCQPTDPSQVRYWYDLLGAIHVNFAVCSINGRVLAAIDLNYERTGPPSRATRIKQSVLGACRIRYLRSAPDHLPSIPELQLLVPQAAGQARGPQPARPMAEDMMPAAGRGLAQPLSPGMARRRERAPLWSETLDYNDSFFAPGTSRYTDSTMGDLRPAQGYRASTSPLTSDLVSSLGVGSLGTGDEPPRAAPQAPTRH